MPTAAPIVLLLFASTVVATSSGAAVIVTVGRLTGLEDRTHFITIIV